MDSVAPRFTRNAPGPRHAPDPLGCPIRNCATCNPIERWIVDRNRSVTGGWPPDPLSRIGCNRLFAGSDSNPTPGQFRASGRRDDRPVQVLLHRPDPVATCSDRLTE